MSACNQDHHRLVQHGHTDCPECHERLPSVLTLSPPQPTGIEAQVCRDIAARQAVGLKKYGITIADNPAGRVERIRHAYEEACDLCVYLRWELSKAEGEVAKVTERETKKADQKAAIALENEYRRDPSKKPLILNFDL